jgi:hypothetical protein
VATWAEVQTAVRTAYTLDNDSEHEFAVTLQSEAGRAQRVMVRHHEAWGHSLLEFRSAFAQVGTFEPTALLEDNLQLPLGSIAQHGRFLVLVHKAVLDFTSVEGVLFLVGRMGILADLLEERTGVDKF